MHTDLPFTQGSCPREWLRKHKKQQKDQSCRECILWRLWGPVSSFGSFLWPLWVSLSCSVVFDSLWPHGLQPTRLLHSWDFPGKSTGVGCHCLLCSSSSLSVKRISAYLRLLIFLPQSWSQLVLHPALRFSWCSLCISEISRVTIYSLDVLLSLFGISLLFHV